MSNPILSQLNIKSVFIEEGFLDKFLKIYQVDEGIEDPVTGAKSSWIVTWQLDGSSSCDYIEITTVERLREELRTEKQRTALKNSRALYLKRKCMDANTFNEKCDRAEIETRNLKSSFKKIRALGKISAQEDFYEPNMYCIVRGSSKIEDESQYDNLCVAGSMESDMAKSVVTALTGTALAAEHLKTIIKEGRLLVSKHISLTEEYENLLEKSNQINKDLVSAKNEISSLKKRLDENFANSMTVGEGEGNVKVADPKQFAKIIRVLEGLSDKIESFQRGESVSGLPIGEDGGLSKELVYFKNMIDIILTSVKG